MSVGMFDKISLITGMSINMRQRTGVFGAYWKVERARGAEGKSRSTIRKLWIYYLAGSFSRLRSDGTSITVGASLWAIFMRQNATPHATEDLSTKLETKISSRLPSSRIFFVRKTVNVQSIFQFRRVLQFLFVHPPTPSKNSFARQKFCSFFVSFFNVLFKF